MVDKHLKWWRQGYDRNKGITKKQKKTRFEKEIAKGKKKI
jgi:hypothetical protein